MTSAIYLMESPPFSATLFSIIKTRVEAESSIMIFLTEYDFVPALTLSGCPTFYNFLFPLVLITSHVIWKELCVALTFFECKTTVYSVPVSKSLNIKMLSSFASSV